MDTHGHVGHDMPRPRVRVRVFRENGRWVWEHQCTHGSMMTSLPCATWTTVIKGAARHAEWCL